jgi:hypothetical protein
MFKLAAIIWIMLGTTLAGIAMIVIVTVPELSDQAMRLIPLLCGAAFVVAIPLSFWVAKRIQAQTRPAA